QRKLDDSCGKSDSYLGGWTQSFEGHLGTLLAPLRRSITSALITTAQGAVNGTRRIVLSPNNVSLEPNIIAEVILDLRREIKRNPNPSSEQNMYIVKDHMEVGLRTGVKFGIYKDAIYTRAFTLTYPTRSMNEARMNNEFIV